MTAVDTIAHFRCDNGGGRGWIKLERKLPLNKIKSSKWK